MKKIITKVLLSALVFAAAAPAFAQGYDKFANDRVILDYIEAMANAQQEFDLLPASKYSEQQLAVKELFPSIEVVSFKGHNIAGGIAATGKNAAASYDARAAVIARNNQDAKDPGAYKYYPRLNNPAMPVEYKIALVKKAPHFFAETTTLFGETVYVDAGMLRDMFAADNTAKALFEDYYTFLSALNSSSGMLPAGVLPERVNTEAYPEFYADMAGNAVYFAADVIMEKMGGHNFEKEEGHKTQEYFDKWNRRSPAFAQVTEVPANVQEAKGETKDPLYMERYNAGRVYPPAQEKYVPVEKEEGHKTQEYYDNWNKGSSNASAKGNAYVPVGKEEGHKTQEYFDNWNRTAPKQENYHQSPKPYPSTQTGTIGNRKVSVPK